MAQTPSNPAVKPAAPEASRDSPVPATPPQKPHTAVVYVHGMGEQRRFEEMSRLIDSLDKYAFQLAQDDPLANRKGRDPRWLVDIRPGLEPCSVRGSKDDVGFVRLDCAPPDAVHKTGSLYRFYEAYWAPLVAGGSPLSSVVPWIARQILTPVRIVRSPWRERQRLRRAGLHSLWRSRWFQRVCRPNGGDLTELIDAYDDFEGLAARRDYSKGTFSQFRLFLGRRFEGHRDRAARFDRIARIWRWNAVATEFGHLVILVTLIGTLAALLGLATYAVWIALGWLSARAFPFASWADLVTSLTQTPANALAILSLILSAAGLTRFVKVYLGDVQFWCTYEETDDKHVKRREILEQATRALEHVLTDDRCQRVVVVAHSLGTAIAMDALLQLGRFNRARPREGSIRTPLQLDKLVAFVTMGSPIDKIHYFFESYRSDYHRYVRVVEGLRGDITETPFAKNRKPHIHWINFWDRADVISGALETPAGSRLPGLRVDNVQVSNYAFPDPGASHSGYFMHRQVIAHLYDVIFKGTADFEFAPATDNGRPNYDALFLPPGTGTLATIVSQALALALPWLLALSLLTGATWGLWLGVTIFVALAAGMLLQVPLGHREPIAPRRSRTSG